MNEAGDLNSSGVNDPLGNRLKAIYRNEARNVANNRIAREGTE
jgi:hypothetical protein